MTPSASACTSPPPGAAGHVHVGGDPRGAAEPPVPGDDEAAHLQVLRQDARGRQDAERAHPRVRGVPARARGDRPHCVGGDPQAHPPGQRIPRQGSGAGGHHPRGAASPAPRPVRGRPPPGVPRGRDQAHHGGGRAGDPRGAAAGLPRLLRPDPRVLRANGGAQPRGGRALHIATLCVVDEGVSGAGGVTACSGRVLSPARGE
mmetsp:Transcript_26206/g.83762  ORF Transcript_26206/g.83762 Transcript_26206/m.83762 type:complete len:203 (-) Transcript_26206:200-808(-)